MPETEYLTVGAAAKEITKMVGATLSPTRLSDAFYKGLVGDEFGPMVAGRRLIAVENLPAIISVLRRRGILPVAMPKAA
jgi:hypothetical protein